MKEVFQSLIHEFQLPLQNPVLVFSLILLIILLSPIVLRRLKIPGIIGLIISGVIIGPHGLNFLENNSAIELFSTIGLLYIMFIAGLDLDLNEFKVNRNKSILFGFFTFILPLGIGFPVCYYLLGYDINASFLTASMFATHTLVAYPIVSRFGVTKNQAVAITVGGTILTDTAVLLILAIIMGSHAGTLNGEFWIRLAVSMAIFVAVMFLIIPRVSRWFFRKLESEKHSHYIYVLAVVFFAAFLAEASGVEPIIGAFLAGLALNRLIPHSSALMNRIEFIGNSLFIPFFLISVGMLVDIRVILKGPTAIAVAGALTFVALFGKWIAAFITRLIFRYSRAQGGLIFGLSSAHAAATLAVILVGYKAGILDENILNGTIILILVTCIVASFATEKAAKKIVISEQGMPPVSAASLLNGDHILLPIANMVNIEKLLEFAILLRDRRSSHPVSILSVVPNNEEAELNILKAQNELEKFRSMASAAEAQVNVLTAIDHNPASGIARASKEVMADIIILGWPERQGMTDWFTGDRLDSILQYSNRTSMVCHFEKPLATHERIVVMLPPLAELEAGFAFWHSKVQKLGQELSIPIVYFATPGSVEALRNLTGQNHKSLPILHVTIENWEDYLDLRHEMNRGDLLIFLAARNGSVSYNNYMENIAYRVEKHFRDYSRIIVYPYQPDEQRLLEGFEDVSSDAIKASIETVQKVGRGLGRVFRKGDQGETRN